MQQQNLAAAKLCYNKALAYLIPDFEGLKADLLTNGYDIHLSNKMERLVNELIILSRKSALQPGLVIWIIQVILVTFCPGQSGRTYSYT